MKNSFWLGVVLLVALPSLAAADPILGVSFGGGFYSIDSSTGTGGLIGSTGVPTLNSLARNSAGALYSAGGVGLVTLDPSTGTASSVAPITGLLEGESIRGLAFSATDVLYAINNGGGQGPVGVDDPLYTINTTTGVATFVGLTGFGNVQALEFSPTGVLYGWDSNINGLIIINPLTGAATDVNPVVGGAVDIQSIAFSPAGILYGGREALYTIDLLTGVPSLVGFGGYTDVRGLEFAAAPTSVPEPATLGLLGMGLVGCALRRRKSAAN